MANIASYVKVLNREEVSRLTGIVSLSTERPKKGSVYPVLIRESNKQITRYFTLSAEQTSLLREYNLEVLAGEKDPAVLLANAVALRALPLLKKGEKQSLLAPHAAASKTHVAKVREQKLPEEKRLAALHQARKADIKEQRDFFYDLLKSKAKQ